MSDDRRNDDGDYQTARQSSAGLLVVVAAVIVIADSLGIGRSVEPLVLFGLLVTAAGLLAVDLPLLRK